MRTGTRIHPFGHATSCRKASRAGSQSKSRMITTRSQSPPLEDISHWLSKIRFAGRWDFGWEMERLLYPSTGVGIEEKSGVYGFEKKKGQGEPAEPANHRQKWKFPETASSTSTFYLIIIIIVALLRGPPSAQCLCLLLPICPLRVTGEAAVAIRFREGWPAAPVLRTVGAKLGLELEVTSRIGCGGGFCTHLSPSACSPLPFLPLFCLFLQSLLLWLDSGKATQDSGDGRPSQGPSGTRTTAEPLLPGFKMANGLFLPALSPGLLCLSFISEGPPVFLLPCSAPV